MLPISANFRSRRSKSHASCSDCQLFDEVHIEVLDDIDVGFDEAHVGTDGNANVQKVLLVGDIDRDGKVGLFASHAFEEGFGGCVGLVGARSA